MSADLLATVWSGLDGAAESLAAASFGGPEAVLPSVYDVTGFAAATVGAATLAAAEFLAARTHESLRPVSVDRRTAAAAFISEQLFGPDGWERPPVWDPIVGVYRSATGWIRLHTNYAYHRAAVETVLGASDREATAAAVAGWDAIGLESAVVAAGGCAAVMHERAVWAATAAGQAAAAEPLVRRAAEAIDSTRPPTGAATRPYDGVRVLDLTRVIAGPVCTRFLAAYGADVLRVDPPGFVGVAALLPETTVGKRTAALDLGEPADRSTFEALVRDAHVVVTGLRAGALDRLGYGPDELHGLNPALVTAALNAYGWDGPWRARRGFDSLVQMSCGIAAAGSAATGRDEPVPLPAQALDHGTGYLLAAAIGRALSDGAAASIGCSLIATANLLTPDRSADPHRCGPPDSAASLVSAGGLPSVGAQSLTVGPGRSYRSGMDLVERAAQRAALSEFLEDTRSGSGALVLVGGEAGAGKSALVSAFLADVAVRVVAGSCDGIATPRPLGPVIEIAAQLEVDVTLARDELFAAVLAALGRSATVLLLEDVHWADDATADFLLYAGRRLDRVPALIVVTYRDDEIGSRPALAHLVGEMSRLSSARRVQVAPLTEPGVAALLAGSPLDAEEVYHQTAGNAFFVTELLAAGHTRPSTVRDVVLGRAAGLSVSGRRVLDVASQLGLRFDTDLLVAASGADADGIDDCLARGVLTRGGDELGFRHELARATIADEIPPIRRASVNRVILRVLEQRRDVDVSRLADHAAAAGVGDAAYRFGRAAGERAASLGSHRQAVHHYRSALRFASERDPRDRAELLERLARECIVTDEMNEAWGAAEDALAAWSETGDPLRVGATHDLLCTLSWHLGRGERADAHERLALEMLEPLGSSAELARALAGAASTAVERAELDAARAIGDRALAMARSVGDEYAEADALGVLGALLAAEHRVDEGVMRLRESLRIAHRSGMTNLAGRSYATLSEVFTAENDFVRADEIIAEGLQYSDDHGLNLRFVCITGVLAETEMYRGRWDDAVADAQGVLARTGTMSVGRIPSLTIIGTIKMRRGDADGYPDLVEARRLADETLDPFRVVPVVLALAEYAWLRGDLVEARTVLASVLDTVVGSPSLVDRGRIAAWSRRLGQRPDIPGGIPAALAAEARGDWAMAADAWAAIDRPYDRALALIEVGTAAGLTEAFETFDRLSARPAATVAGERLRALGERVPRGMRPTTRGNPAGLTAREVEVLGLLSAAMTNAEIAAELFISDKTVEHHVSRVLGKLGVASRREAVRAASELDLPAL